MSNDEPTAEELAWSHEAHKRRQALRGLELTPAERLHWLETTMTELRPLVGRARQAAEPVGTETDPESSSGG